MLFNVESLPHTLSTCFEPLYANMYHIGLSDGAVSHCTLWLEISGATSVFRPRALNYRFLLRPSKHSIRPCHKFYKLLTYAVRAVAKVILLVLLLVLHMCGSTITSIFNPGISIFCKCCTSHSLTSLLVHE